ncbi:MULTISPECIES: type II toxin-antitoxin system VapC family toxin [Mycolicibacterium]|uniref:Ribonuclease VapC n=1 Tax=Mycolicibacterium chitae TaxID=1792 RepID=A0A448IAV6_MYCCI|nr:type II toxin-antitoxin system VapC family toxin [Mycolicibacterium chitae]VEG49543.1 putative nucleic acid-binding protein, contains PIN domain [Mycolicibacterium chitae]
MRRIVCDASAVVAALLDSGEDGRWAAAKLIDAELFAPALLPFVCANIIRRLEARATITSDQAALAHADLLDLPVSLWPYELLAETAWPLRRNLTAYDAAYVALAELLTLPLVTLDRRIARAPNLPCSCEVRDLRD